LLQHTRYLANLARPTLAEGAADLFAALVPMRVTAAASEFSAQLDDVVRAACAEADNATALARQTLAEGGLPGSVEAHETGAGIPDSCWGRIARVQAMGGGAALSALLTGNRGAAERCTAQLEQVSGALATEEAEDGQCRAQFGAAAWARPPSASLSAGLREDAARYARLLAEARRSDDVVAAQLTQADADGVGAELAATRGALDARMPPPSSTATVDTSALTALLVECGTLLRGRDVAKEELNALRASADVTPLLLRSQSGGLDPGVVFAQALAPARAIATKVDQSVSLQPGLMGRIAAANATFNRARGADPATAAREAVMQKLAAAVDGFDKLHSDLTSGAQFYTDLTHRVLQLYTTTRDHCEARALQKRDLLLTLQAGQAQAAATGGDAAMAVALQQQLNVGGGQSGGAGGGGAPMMAAPAMAAVGAGVNVHTGLPVAAGMPVAGSMPLPAAAAPPPMYAAMDQPGAAAPPPYPGGMASAGAVPQAAPVAAAAPMGGGGVNPQAVANLMSMGFERGAAEAALVARGGNEQEAINQLLGQ
jgi:hypothetical protein